MIPFYGIEAARASLLIELKKTFSVYGIDIDHRHLSLIGDAMTSSGTLRAFNRLGLRYHSSPLQQMSFETSMNFLTSAVERTAVDSLNAPASAIVCGRPAFVGTGLHRVITKVNY